MYIYVYIDTCYAGDSPPFSREAPASDEEDNRDAKICRQSMDRSLAGREHVGVAWDPSTYKCVTSLVHQFHDHFLTHC